MSITLFGTCRINNIHNHNNLNELISYCHSTKEILQLIKFLKNEIIIPSPYNKFCFRSGIVHNKEIIFNESYKKAFEDSSICVIEICSKKKYIHNNFYLHHLCVDRRKNYEIFTHNTPKYIKDECEVLIQSDAEIENDILKIKQELYPKTIIFVTHYNSKINGKYLNSRNELIQLLELLCKKHNIFLINPMNILSGFEQNYIINDDLGHYTENGKNIFTEYANKFISYILSNQN